MAEDTDGSIRDGGRRINWKWLSRYNSAADYPNLSEYSVSHIRSWSGCVIPKPGGRLSFLMHYVNDVCSEQRRPPRRQKAPGVALESKS